MTQESGATRPNPPRDGTSALCQSVILMVRTQCPFNEISACFLILPSQFRILKTLFPDVGCQIAGPDGKLGVSYTGRAHTTQGGIECQMWTSNSPHPHGLSRFGDHNYCRNTAGGSDPRVWCYTTDPNTRWDFCDVPKCKDEGTLVFLKHRQQLCIM